MSNQSQPASQQAQLAAQQDRIAELEREVASFRRLISNVPGMVYQFILRPDGSMDFTFVSEGAREIYGHEPDEIVSDFNLPFKMLHPDDVVTFSSSLKESAASLSAFRWEGRLTHHGKTHWIQAASRPNKQSDGSILWDGIVLDITHRKQSDAALARSHEQEETIRLQEEMLAQLSTPLIPLTGQIMVMPLIGRVDQARAERIQLSLLQGVAEKRVTTTILDITGVPAVDEQTAAMIVNAARAVKLLGAEVILTGVRAEVAQTLVSLRVDLSDIRTLGSLQAAIAHVMARPA